MGSCITQELNVVLCDKLEAWDGGGVGCKKAGTYVYLYKLGSHCFYGEANTIVTLQLKNFFKIPPTLKEKHKQDKHRNRFRSEHGNSQTQSFHMITNSSATSCTISNTCSTCPDMSRTLVASQGKKAQATLLGLYSQSTQTPGT